MPNSTLLAHMQAANDIVQELVSLSQAQGDSLQDAESCPRAIATGLAMALVARLGMASAHVWFYDPSDRSFRSVARAGLKSPDQERLMRLYADDTPLGQIVRRRQPVLSNTLQQEPWILSRQWVAEQGLQSFAGYPINLGSEPVGALSVFSYQPLQPEFLEVLKFIAAYTASAIVNVRQNVQLQQQAEREALLNRIANTAHRSLDWDQIVSLALASLQETLGLSRCCFYVLAEGCGAVRVSHEARSPSLPPADGLYPLGDFGAICERIAQGEVERASDLWLEPSLPEAGRRVLEHLQMRAAVLIPVLPDQPRAPDPALLANWNGDGMLGLVGAFKSVAYVWQPAEVELLQSVAHQLAIALTRAQLFEQSRQQAERLALLHSITAVIRSSLDPATLFHAITQQIGEAFEADICTLDLWQPQEGCLRPVGIYAPKLMEEELEVVLPGLTLLPDPPPPTLWQKQFLPGSSLGGSPCILPDGQGEGILLVPLQQEDATIDGQAGLIGSISLRRHHLDPGRPAWTQADLELAKAVAEQAAIAISQAGLLTQTQQLLAQTQRQAEQASLVNRMTDRIRHSLDLDEILQAAVEEVGLALHACRAQFVFVDPHQEQATFRHAYARPGIDSWLNSSIPLRHSPIAPYLQAQPDPIAIKVWQGLDAFNEATQERLRQAGVQSLMVARLYLSPDAYGVLSVHHCRTDYNPVSSSWDLGRQMEPPRPWTKEEQHLLKLVAEQLVIAINQSRLYEKTTQQARREMLLNEITSQIRTSLDSKQVLQAIVRALATTLELDRCEIELRLRPHTEVAGADPPILWVKGGFAPNSDQWLSMQMVSREVAQKGTALSSCAQTPPRATLPISRGIPPAIEAELRAGRPFVIADTEQTSNCGSEEMSPPFFSSHAVRSLALIPILSGELLGTIALISHPTPRAFAPDELALATAVAEQAVIALQQAQLYEQTRIFALRESLLRQVAQQLSSTYEPDQIVQIALAGMADALQVDRCDFVTSAQADEPVESGARPLQVEQEFRRSEQTPSRLGWILPADLGRLIWADWQERCRSLVIEDVTTYPLPNQTRQNLLQSQIRALLCVPLATDAATVAGFLCAQDPGRAFSNADTELVQALADITAVALQRAQLYERARQQETTAAALRGLTEGREAESRRLAADLHDQTLADLGALSRQIQHLTTADSVTPQGQWELQAMSNQLRETIAELRGIVEDLQPTAMRAFTLGSALRSLLERAAQRSGQPLVTRFDDRSDTLLNRLDPVAQSTLFRIVQEALNNIVKHAQAHRIDVIIVPVALPEAKASGQGSFSHLEVKIIDDGIGMPAQIDPAGRHGLSNMRYRAELIAASIEWRGRRNGSGTVVQLLLPLPPVARPTQN